MKTLRSWLRRLLPGRVLEALQDARYLGLPEPFRTVRPHTMLSELNLFFLQELCRRIEELGLRGDLVECGVYRGGSAGVLAYQALRSRFARRLWLFDSFQEMPPTSAQDDQKAQAIVGQFRGSEAQTRRILQRLRVPEDRFRIVPGWLEETLPGLEPPPVALLHVDCNFYGPVKLTLETFFPRLEPLGFVVLNDYGCYAGCRKATDEFLAGQSRKPDLIQIDQDAYYFQNTP